MISIKYFREPLLALALVFLTCACDKSGSTSSSASCSNSQTKTAATGSGAGNTMTVTVGNNGECGTTNYPNKPCVEVTLCQKGTTNCQTIKNILLDTGSYGLRVFSSLVTIPTTSPGSCSDGGVLAECVGFGDGSSEWGLVALADMKLGNEPPITVPIHLINSAMPGAPSNCQSSQSTPDTSPTEAGFNGILGVGQLAQDCGTTCVTHSEVGLYYSCNGSSCVPATATLDTQVSNPVALLPVDNNGVVLTLPAVASPTTTVSGTMYLGVGTQSNNTPTPSALKILFSPYNNNFGTDTIPVTIASYSSASMPGFLDSGTNFYGVPPPAAVANSDCGNTNACLTGFYCPSSTQAFAAVNASATTSTTSSFMFSLSNVIATGPFASFDSNCSPTYGPNLVQPSVGTNTAYGGGTAFADWGLPFFYGRSVYVGIESTTSNLGTGPYWAY